MMGSLLFSFFVPVYNTSKYLDKCMGSLLCQRGADFEILLIDDGSTDSSGVMCDRYAEEYPDTVRVIHKENEGLLLTRRRGFKEAKGDWFICIDSDDYICSCLLQTVVNVISENNPDMVMYNFSYVTDSGEKTESRLAIPDRSVFEGEGKQLIYAHRLLTNDINSMCMKAIKKEIIDVDADYTGCGIRNMCEDAVQVLAPLAKAKRIVYLSRPLYYYRKGQGSITAISTYENWIASKNCFLITERYLDIWNVSEELRQRFYTHNLESLSNFLRWIFAQNDNNLQKPYSEILHIINSHPAFIRCLKMYNKAYARTPYLRFSVPRIMKYVQKENHKGLKRFFAIESKLR